MALGGAHSQWLNERRGHSRPQVPNTFLNGSNHRNNLYHYKNTEVNRSPQQIRSVSGYLYCVQLKRERNKGRGHFL